MGCTLDELPTDNEQKKIIALNSRDKRDLQKRLQEILNDMNTEETKDFLRTSLQHSIEAAKIRAKENLRLKSTRNTW